MQITNAWLQGSTLQIVSRDAAGERVVTRVPARWTAYWKTADVEPDHRRMLRAARVVTAVREVGEYMEVEFRDQWARRAVVEGTREKASPLSYAPCYEGDVDPVRRYLADTGAEIQRPRVAWIDLETDSRVPFAEKERARILTYAIVSHEDERVWTGILAADTAEAEAALLVEMFGILAEFDLVAAWNGDGFDFPVMQARLKAHRLDAKIGMQRWLWLDFMLLYKRLNTASESGEEKTSMKLNAVAMQVVGEGKEVLDATRTWEYWSGSEDQKRELVHYNLVDTALLKKIEQKTGFLELFFAIASVSQVLPDTRGLLPTQQMDGYMLRLGRERGVRFPTAKFRDSESQYEGAYVLAPTRRGILRDVHVADFASLYPSIIVTWNMSLETITHEGSLRGPVEPGLARSPLNGVHFRQAEEGILPTALREMIRMRKVFNDRKASLPPGTPDWKHADRISTAYKVAANSFYGVLGTTSSRFYRREIAESVTKCGRWLIEKTIEEARRMSMDTVYGDTDSVFVTGANETFFDDFVTHCNTVLYPSILAQQGVLPERSTVKLAYEKAFDRVVFVTAKRYCNPPECPIWMADGTFKRLGDIQEGDLVMGWSEGGTREDGTRYKRRLGPSRVEAIHRRDAPIVKVTFESGRVVRCTPDHRWRVHGRKSKYSDYVPAKVGRELSHVVDIPSSLTPDQQMEADWLGGIWDGEGSLASDNRGQIVIAQSRARNPEVCDRIERALKCLGMAYAIRTSRNRTSVCLNYELRSSLQNRLNFLTWCRPAKSDRLRAVLCRSHFSTGDRVVSIEPDGFGPVMGMTTTTGNYVAWGFASKNCGRFLHYKGKRATADSKPEIKGLEYKRGDSLRLARTLQEQAIMMVLSGNVDVREYTRLVEESKRHVLDDELPLEEVVLSQTLSKPLKEYEESRKTKKDGTLQADLMHVGVAKKLAARGEEVRQGVRIAYVVTDAEADPTECVPASDYDGRCDRFYLWESKIYPPTLRFLEAAFPEHAQTWAAYAKARPKKTRAYGRAWEEASTSTDDGGLGPLFAMGRRLPKP